MENAYEQQPLAVNKKSSRLRGDRHLNLFSTSDENAMLKQIKATHAPDDRDFDFSPILDIIEDILHRSHPITPGATLTQLPFSPLDENALQTSFVDILELLAQQIHRISCEISYKSTAGGDAHGTTLAILNLLSSYSWDAKLVLAFAAFSVSYGEFWLVAQLYPTNSLASSVALLQQIPEIMESADALKTRFDAITGLIRVALDVTKCIVRFKNLPSHYISHDETEMQSATAHIPTAVYWTIRSIVTCASQLFALIGMGVDYISSTAEANWEISSLEHKLTNIYDHLKKQLLLCERLIERKRQEEAYSILKYLMEHGHLDNMKVLKALIYAKDDQPPLFDGYTAQKCGLEVLRKKIVLFFISDLDISTEELQVLYQLNDEAKQQPSLIESQFEIVWLPIVDRSIPWNDQRQKRFEDVQNSMPWYSVQHPSMIDPAVNEYITKEWGFKKQPLLVVLDPQARVSNQNALHMVWIWRSLAFPFTRAREEALWREVSWNIDLVADHIDESLLEWVSKDRYICLFGGDDLEWIRKFTKTANEIAKVSGIQLEMLYVGKSNPKDKIRRINNIILQENLSNILVDLKLMWYFWGRLGSMWYSKVQHGMTVETDPIMKEIMTVLSYDGSNVSWALFTRGAYEMTKAKGELMLKALTQYEVWRVAIPTRGFVLALDDYLNQNRPPHHCNRLIIPGVAGHIPERITCAECGRPMEKYFMYRCCDE